MERNKAYHVTILFAEGQFLVSVNGNHFCGYTYRVPLSQLTEIEVRGMVDVNEVNYKQLVTYPEEEEGSVLPVPIGNLESIAPTEIVSVFNFCVGFNVVGSFSCFSRYRLQENYRRRVSYLVRNWKFMVA